jgi:outer membrane protein OmpA-like peptidoglycan-associated protein
MKMKAYKIFLLVIFLAGSSCYADYFSTPFLKAEWEFNEDSSYCHLKQNVPLFGRADFMHQSGELLRFSIRENRYKAEIVKASLSVDVSPWIQGSIRDNDYPVHLDLSADRQNYPRLSVYGDTAEIMLDAMSQGMYPTFTYVRAGVSGLLSETSVAVSSINFLKAYDQFAECRKDFLPSWFKTVLEKSLFFKSVSKELSARVFNQLKDTARYLKEVKNTRVVIVSDTAVAGSRDKTWFLKRANIISEKLNKLGVAKNKITIKSGIHTVSRDSKTIQLSVFGPDALTAIYYRKGNTRLTQNEKQRLELLVHYAEAFLPSSQLIIKSHTDSKGSRVNNLRVSQKRGDEIKRYLVSKGMDENKVQVKAYGESNPIKSNRFPTGRSQNRRAIIDFTG